MPRGRRRFRNSALVIPLVLAALVAVPHQFGSADRRMPGTVHPVAMQSPVPTIDITPFTRQVRYPTSWPALNHAIRALPGYHPGWARWRVGGAALGWYATTDWYHAVVRVHRSVPKHRLYSVVAHEWSHIVQVRDYGGSVARAVRALHRYYGGHGILGAEYAADCMARLQGATWTHYTACNNRHWLHGAHRLLRRLHV